MPMGESQIHPWNLSLLQMKNYFFSDTADTHFCPHLPVAEICQCKQKKHTGYILCRKIRLYRMDI